MMSEQQLSSFFDFKLLLLSVSKSLAANSLENFRNSYIEIFV